MKFHAFGKKFLLLQNMILVLKQFQDSPHTHYKALHESQRDLQFFQL